MNEGSLSLTRRNLIRRHQNRGWVPVSGGIWGISAYCPGGVRRIGSMSPVQALVWNVLKACPDTCMRTRATDVGGWRGRGSKQQESVRSRVIDAGRLGFGKRRDKPAWRRRWKSSTSKG